MKFSVVAFVSVTALSAALPANSAEQLGDPDNADLHNYLGYSFRKLGGLVDPYQTC